MPLVGTGAVDHEGRKDFDGFISRVFDVELFNLDGIIQHARPLPQAARLDALVASILSPSSHSCVAIYQLQNFNKKEKLERTFFGLVSDNEPVFQRLTSLAASTRIYSSQMKRMKTGLVTGVSTLGCLTQISENWKSQNLRCIIRLNRRSLISS